MMRPWSRPPEFSTAAAEATHRSPYTSGVGEPNAPSVDKDFSCNQAVQDTESHLNSSGPSRTDAILQRYSESGWGLDPAGDSRKLSDTSYCIDEYSCDVDYRPYSEATARSCEETRLLSKPSIGRATGVVGSWWSDRPSRIHRVFGWCFQPTSGVGGRGEVNSSADAVLAQNGEASGSYGNRRFP